MSDETDTRAADDAPHTKQTGGSEATDEASTSETKVEGGFTIASPEPALDLEDPHRRFMKQLRTDDAPRELTVRDLLASFGYKRRGSQVVRDVRRELQEHGLSCDPDFEEVTLDAKVTISKAAIHPTTEPAPKSEPLQPARATEPATAAPKIARRAIVPLVGQLPSATRKLVTVSRDDTLLAAQTFMQLYDYSQLPVMQGRHDVKGVVSWKLIGDARSLGREPEFVRDCMGEVRVIKASAPLFEAVREVLQHDHVFVASEDKRITGIVTTWDVAVEFPKLSEPYLVVGQIEDHLRNLIEERVAPSPDELAHAKHGEELRAVESVSDLSFGEYANLLGQDGVWDRLRLGLDRSIFFRAVDRVRSIRNDIMHFSPDPLGDEDIQFLRNVERLLGRC